MVINWKINYAYYNTCICTNKHLGRCVKRYQVCLYMHTLNFLIRNTKCNKTLIIYLCMYLFLGFTHNIMYRKRMYIIYHTRSILKTSILGLSPGGRLFYYIALLYKTKIFHLSWAKTVGIALKQNILYTIINVYR